MTRRRADASTCRRVDVSTRRCIDASMRQRVDGTVVTTVPLLSNQKFSTKFRCPFMGACSNPEMCTFINFCSLSPPRWPPIHELCSASDLASPSLWIIAIFDARSWQKLTKVDIFDTKSCLKLTYLIPKVDKSWHIWRHKLTKVDVFDASGQMQGEFRLPWSDT